MRVAGRNHGISRRRPLNRDSIGEPVHVRCALARWLSARLVELIERDGLSATCPWASRLPYEVQIAPVEPEQDGLRSELLAPALRLLAELVRRLHRLEGPVPLNAWLHDGPHWHLELVPRLSILAGLELGAGVYVNSLPPEEAAARLRAA